MPSSVLTYAAAGLAPAAADLAQRVAKAWPISTAAPTPRAMPLDALELGLHAADTRAFADQIVPLLVVLGPEHLGTRLYQLVDSLQAARIPAVVALPAVDTLARRSQGGGVIIVAASDPPEVIAAMLLALSERQSTIVELERELSIHTRCEGGMRGEIDRMHDELNLAATIQRELLPRRMPRLPGVSFAALFRPVSYVSGDIYDVVQLDEEHAGFFIADAVGHGVPAALMTMVIAQSLHMTHQTESLGRREIIPPAEAMTRLNDEMCRWQRDNAPRFSTAVYGVIHGPTRRVCLVGAGHPPPLRVSRTPGDRRQARLRRIDTDGPLLGVFPGERYGSIEFTLEPGETLLLYSDGFETAFAPPELTAPAAAHQRRSAQDYLDVLAALPWPDAASAGITPARALATLARRMDEQSGSLHQIDDVTALAISACESATTAEDDLLAGLRAA